MSQHRVQLRVYFGVFALLLIGTAATVAVAFVDLGIFNTPVALAIAVTKALVVILFFMHVRWSSRLTQVFAGTGFAFLLIGFAFSLADYLTRHWDYLPKGWE